MSWFSYKNIHSDSMGLIVDTYPPISRPERRIETIKVPGRHGELTLQTGPAVYEAYVREIRCVIPPDADVPALTAWLTGRGDLIVGNEPDYVYDARAVSEIYFEKIIRERNWREVDIAFLCQPLKRLVTTEADIVLTSSGGTVINPGHVESRPLIKVEGSGDITLMVSGVITVITGLTEPILIDSDLGMATNVGRTINMSALVSGEWPRIGVGSKTISWSGAVTKVTVTPRWRWL
jgi:phage-related protein